MITTFWKVPSLFSAIGKRLEWSTRKQAWINKWININVKIHAESWLDQTSLQSYSEPSAMLRSGPTTSVLWYHTLESKRTVEEEKRNRKLKISASLAFISAFFEFVWVWIGLRKICLSQPYWYRPEKERLPAADTKSCTRIAAEMSNVWIRWAAPAMRVYQDDPAIGKGVERERERKESFGKSKTSSVRA